MRIGEFSRKNNITQDAIRHYIDMGLLVVEKHGSQYKFSEENSCDIEKIFTLKQLDFSLTEIQEILCFNRLEGDMSNDFRNFYLSLLERKKDQIMKAQQKYTEIDAHLKDRINELKMDNTNKRKRMGFPLSSIGILLCPYCKMTLDISSGTVEKNTILEAIVQCECGYIANIENGIYIDKIIARKKKKLPTKKEFIEAASPKYINFIYNGTLTLIDYIQKHGNEPKYIMELDHCAGRFLMQYIDYLPKYCTYILVCHDKERIIEMKHTLELQHEHCNFLFFCCDIDQLPITNATIDIIIDHWMSRGYAKSTSKSLLDVVTPFLKQEGLLTGAYPNLGMRSKEFLNIPLELRDNLNRDKILEKLDHSNFLTLDVVDIGPVIENNPYIDLSDKELYVTLYVGKKKKNFDMITTGTQLEMKQKHNLIS